MIGHFRDILRKERLNLMFLQYSVKRILDRPLGPVVTLFPTNQEVLSSMISLSKGELFHVMYRLVLVRFIIL